MRILFIGDIYASPGRRLVAESLKHIVEEQDIDLVIANGENAAGGFGITPLIAEELLRLGIDVLTTGNHIWDKKEIYEYFARQPRLLRPGNYPRELPGSGMIVAETRRGERCAVMNLQGRTHMPAIDCPFRKATELLESLDPSVKVRFLDFHAEVTSEKMAMGWFLDGKVTAVIGTHTHIATADSRILPRGTAYQTDVGMTGPYDSVIGADKDAALRRFLTALPVRLEAATDLPELHAVIVDADSNTGTARSITRIPR